MGQIFSAVPPLAARIGLLTLAATLSVPADRTLADDSAVTCTNPASGATWQIKIDYDRSTVDSYPATIGEAKISWHDGRDGGNYTLDRQTGKLTVIVASSTGGYFLHDDCKLEK